ncbi:MAG: sulfatase-like hydrolase/transferase [Vicinamibacteria bacterium]
MKRATPALAIAALTIAALAAGARCGRRAPDGPWPQAPVILISIDTLRADRLPAYGYGRGSTPQIDALASEGVVFEDTISHCPLTLPAHASLLSGLLPPRHGVRDNVGYRLKDEHRTLATRFRAAGRPTGAAVSAFVMRAATGLAQGFDRYDDALATDAKDASLGAQQRDGAAAVESLSRWIEAQGTRPFFAFLHLYEPHTPYAPPEPWRSRQSDPYDGEVAYADELVGRFLARLKAAGVYEKAVVMLTSDHGEGLGDHGEQEHGFFLYREAVRVPLLLRLPGRARAGTRVRGVVAQVDLAATLLDLTGLAGDGLDGASLRGALASGQAPPRRVYSETFFPRRHFGWSELLAVSEERFRFIRAPRNELYDTSADPRETRNLASERPDAVAAMSGWLDRVAGTRAPAAPEAVPAETREALQALGYVGGGVRAPKAGAALPDPKDKVQVYEAWRRATQLAAEQHDAEAVPELRKVLEDSPGMLDAWETLGLSLQRLGREGEAIRALERALEGDPQRASTHLALVRVHTLAGRGRQAERHARAAAASDPGRAYETLAQMMLEQRRYAEAADYARRSLAADRERVMSHYVLGAVARSQGRCAEAVAAFRAAAEAKSRQVRLVVPGLHSGTADCLARLGREAEAEVEFSREIEQIPWSRDGRVGLALLRRSQGRDAEARDALAGIVTRNSQAGAEDYWIVVRTLAGIGDAAGAREWATRARQRFPNDPRFR